MRSRPRELSVPRGCAPPQLSNFLVPARHRKYPQAEDTQCDAASIEHMCTREVSQIFLGWRLKVKVPKIISGISRLSQPLCIGTSNEIWTTLERTCHDGKTPTTLTKLPPTLTAAAHRRQRKPGLGSTAAFLYPKPHPSPMPCRTARIRFRFFCVGLPIRRASLVHVSLDFGCRRSISVYFSSRTSPMVPPEVTRRVGYAD